MAKKGKCKHEEGIQDFYDGNNPENTCKHRKVCFLTSCPCRDYEEQE